MATGSAESEVDLTFPHQTFPEYTPFLGDAKHLLLGFQYRRRVEQRFNILEYGRFSGLLEEEGGGATVFRQNGRGKFVSYTSACLPLCPPNTRTPYDDVVADTHNFPEEGMKHRVQTQVQYFHSNFRSVYVPLADLCSELETSNSLSIRSAEFDSGLGSVVDFLPYQLPDCLGCVFYASGPGLQCLTVGLLVPRKVGVALPAPLPQERFIWSSRLHSPLHLEPVEALRLPGRIHQIQASLTQGRAIVCVRCVYHVAFLEGPSHSSLLAVLEQYRKHLQQAMPTTSQATPTATQAMPTATQATPTQATPTTFQATHTASQATPTTSQATPTTSQAMPTATQATPTQATPTTFQATHTASQATPTTSQATPTTSQATPTTSQATPTTSQATPADPTFQPGLLQKIALFKTSVVTSCTCLSPYIAGEALVVMETGAVYQWSQDNGLTRLQSPLTTPDPSDHTHFWQCCYGPHPRSLVLAEQSGVSLGDFRTGGLSFRPLLAPPSEHLPPSAIVTALAPHPSHPFHLLVATSEHLLLLDTRQPGSVLLAQLLECSDAPRFLSPLHAPSGDTLLLLSSHHVPESVVYSYAGGSCRKGAGNRVPAPHSTCLPHTTACYSDFGSQLSHIGPMYSVSYRLKQPLAGSCLVDLGGGSYAAVVISTLGDMFFQCWRYEASPAPIPLATPPTLRGYHLWMKEAWEQEKRLLAYTEQRGGVEQSGLDFSPIMEYLQAASSVCLKCYTAARTFFPNVDALNRRVVRGWDTGGEHGVESQDSQQETADRCPLCGQKKDPYFSRLAIPNIRHRPESSGATGLQSLEKACVFTKPEGAGFDQRLWEGWAEEGGEEEEEEATLRGEDGPSDEPALPTPGTSQPAAAGSRRPRVRKNTPSKTPRAMGF